LIKPDIEEVTEKLGKPAFKIRIGRVEKHVIVEYVSALNGEVLYQEVVADVENEMSQALNRSLGQLKIFSERISDDAVKLLAVDLLIRLGFNEKAARLFVEILGTIFLTRAPPFLEKVIVQRPDGVTVEITSLEDLVMAFESPRQRVTLSLIDGIAQFARLS